MKLLKIYNTFKIFFILIFLSYILINLFNYNYQLNKLNNKQNINKYTDRFLNLPPFKLLIPAKFDSFINKGNTLADELLSEINDTVLYYYDRLINNKDFNLTLFNYFLNENKNNLIKYFNKLEIKDLNNISIYDYETKELIYSKVYDINNKISNKINFLNNTLIIMYDHKLKSLDRSVKIYIDTKFVFDKDKDLDYYILNDDFEIINTENHPSYLNLIIENIKKENKILYNFGLYLYYYKIKNSDDITLKILFEYPTKNLKLTIVKYLLLIIIFLFLIIFFIAIDRLITKYILEIEKANRLKKEIISEENINWIEKYLSNQENKK